MSAIDDLNKATMASAEAVSTYAHDAELSAPERALIERIADETRGQPILDLGVGAGRTVAGLRAVSEDYVGVDYTLAMTETCRARYPRVRFEHGDARDLSRFPDSHFQLVVFSCNGLGMVGHADRLRVLAEVRRVLRPGGAFLFSNHNLRCPQHHVRFELPPFELAKNPARVAVRAVRFARSLITRARNRRRYRPLEERHADHAILNSTCHDYGTLLYYIELAAQRRQLEQAGFAPGALAYDLSGHEISGDTLDDSICYLARRPRT